MQIETLMNIGLTDKEAETYLTLLKKGPLTMAELTETTPYKRGDLYNIAQSLENWGLVILEKDGKKRYKPAHPSKLKKLLDDQEQEVAEHKKLLNTGMDELESLYSLISDRPGIRFYAGKEEVIQAYETLLDMRQPIDSIEDKGNMVDFFPEYVKQYVKKRIARQIPNRAIAPDTNTINDPDESKYIDSRLISAEEFPFTMDIKICGDTVQLVTLKAENAIAVHIIHPIIAENFRVLHRYIWKRESERQGKTKTKTVAGDSLTVFN